MLVSILLGSQTEHLKFKLAKTNGFFTTSFLQSYSYSIKTITGWFNTFILTLCFQKEVKFKRVSLTKLFTSKSICRSPVTVH